MTFNDGFTFGMGIAAALMLVRLLGEALLRLQCYLGDDESNAKLADEGLRLHVDPDTGVEYLSDGKGGMVVREAAE